MSPERWKQIEAVYFDVLACQPDSRTVLLGNVCAGDADLRREVESLLRANDKAGLFLSPGELEGCLQRIAIDTEQSVVERILGHYEIEERIGSGGMGQVYRARDNRLGRTVAVKVLPPSLAKDEKYMVRFRREAQALAALNHPNVCTLHDFGDQGGAPYLVMEYLEGETLSARIARGLMPVPDACRVGIQIGEGLDQAHRLGITHRDLKPGNVMLTGPAGDPKVKLLDFGLAKLPAHGSASRSTLLDLTMEGTLIGTLRYMAPEQLEGKDADARSDVFGLGCVLYEMLTGKRAFDGESQASIIAAILASDPAPVSAVQPVSPPALDRVVRKCLAKQPDDRWQTVRDLVSELRWILEEIAETRLISRQSGFSRRSHLVLLVAGALGSFLLGWAVFKALQSRESAPSAPVVRFQVSPASGQAFTADSLPVLSPDGKKIVFNTAREHNLSMRSLDSLESKDLPGTAAGHLPFWSGDGHWIGYFASAHLWKARVDGGQPVMLTDVRGGAGGSWNKDGIMIFGPTPRSPIMRMPEEGGTPVPATRLVGDQTGHAWPSFLPDGRHFLFTAYSANPGHGGVFAASLDSAEVTPILMSETNAQYLAPGFLVYGRQGVLLAQHFDQAKLKLSGQPFPVAETVSPVARPIGAAFSVAGRELAYHPGAAARNHLAWHDASGALVADLGQAGDYASPAISPDGRSVAVALREVAGKARDIWIYDSTRGSRMRLTFNEAEDFSPLWSPDGRQVAFLSNRDGVPGVYKASAAATGQDELLAKLPGAIALLDWTPDSKSMLVSIQPDRKAPSELWQLPASGGGRPTRILAGPFAVEDARVSHDGKWLAYQSNETYDGGRVIYLQSFPPGAWKLRVSENTGEFPQWSSDGKVLYFIEERNYKVMSAALRYKGNRIEADRPAALFQGPIGDLTLSRTYALSPQNNRFLLVTAEHEQSTKPFTVFLNWQPDGKN